MKPRGYIPLRFLLLDSKFLPGELTVIYGKNIEANKMVARFVKMSCNGMIYTNFDKNTISEQLPYFCEKAKKKFRHEIIVLDDINEYDRRYCYNLIKVTVENNRLYINVIGNKYTGRQTRYGPLVWIEG